LSFLPDLSCVFGFFHVDCGTAASWDDGGFGLVEAELVVRGAAAEFDHDGAEDEGHAFGGLVGVCHVGEGGREAFEVLHIVVAVVGVFDERECGY
jgi:hypothetical protein